MKRPPPNKSPEPLALSVPLSRFTSRVGGGSAFYVRPSFDHENKITRYSTYHHSVLACGDCRFGVSTP